MGRPRFCECGRLEAACCVNFTAFGTVPISLPGTSPRSWAWSELLLPTLVRAGEAMVTRGRGCGEKERKIEMHKVHFTAQTSS